MNSSRSLFLLFGSGAAGLAVAMFAAWVARLVLRDRGPTAASWEFERSRRATLCKLNSTYRWFEPVIDELAAMYAKGSKTKLDAIAKQLISAAEPAQWKPEEYLAVKLMEGAIGGAFAFVLGYIVGGVFFGLIAGGFIAFALQQMGMSDLKTRAEKRVSTVKRRLPFAVDLMALMLEAGGGLLESLTTLVRDLRGHPLGDELNHIVSEIGLGRSLNESLARFQQRLPDEDVAELVFMIVKGDEFGTPMAQTFRTQAEQMRLKRSQWAEKAAGTAQVNIVLPGMIIMIACLMIIGAPFLLAAIGI
jgi:pilus assembly protein TadC